MVAGVFAFVLDGSARSAFGAVALVLVATAVYCVAELWSETRAYPPVEFEESPVVTPLPQSSVTQVYNPPSPPDAFPERTRDK